MQLYYCIKGARNVYSKHHLILCVCDLEWAIQTIFSTSTVYETSYPILPGTTCKLILMELHWYDYMLKHWHKLSTAYNDIICILLVLKCIMNFKNVPNWIQLYQAFVTFIIIWPKYYYLNFSTKYYFRIYSS